MFKTSRYFASTKPATSGSLAMGALVMAMVLTGCSEAPDPAANMDRHTVRPSTFRVSVEEAGVVEATRVISVISPRRGRLIYLPDTGTPVEANQIIAQLETESEEESVERRFNELESVKADLEATIESLQMAMRDNAISRDLAESQLEFSTIRLQDVSVRLAETQVLLESSVVPADDLRAAQYDVDSSQLNTVTTELSLRSQVADNVQQRENRLTQIARSELRSQRALRVLDRAQREIEESTMRSPIDGIFIRTSSWDRQSRSMREPRPGEDVRRRQELGTIPDLDSLVIRTQIPESYLLRVTDGTRATVEFDAHESLELEGVVSSIGNVAIEREVSAGGAIAQTDQSSGQKVFEVLIDLHEPDPRLRPGITAQVRIDLDRQDRVLTIPVESVWTDREGSTVLVVGPDGRSERREVSLGSYNGDVVIVEEGLKDGEVVAVPSRADSRST